MAHFAMVTHLEPIARIHVAYLYSTGCTRVSRDGMWPGMTLGSTRVPSRLPVPTIRRL